MRSVVLRSLAVIGLGAVALVGVLWMASNVDARAPEVLEMRVTQPAADDSSVAAVTTSLEIVFNEEVDHDSAIAALQIQPPVAGAASWSGTTMTFTPAESLALDTAYEVTIADGVLDLAGNAMATLPPPFAFTTAGRPTVTETIPVDGADDVPSDESIALRFSTLMDTASVEAALEISPPVTHELRWSGELLEIVPDRPLDADRPYRVTIGADAADAAGVTIGAAVSIAFRTAAPGLAITALVPADGVDGIAPVSPIAVIFDRPIDAGDLDADLLTIEPAVAGTLEVVSLPGDELDADEVGRVLRFTPSSPLPPTTTFEVTVAARVTAIGGGALAEPVTWTFTTGAPVEIVSNQVTFLTERGGISNVWVMNPDGTGQRQLSVELSPVLAYAVAPDGTSLVVSDGRRLIYSRPDGSDRRALTGEGLLEFDAAYHPSGDRTVFARADAATGRSLGLWTWEVGGGDATRIELTDEPAASGSPASTPDADATPMVRAPAYSPDGQALAFVDSDGSVGVLELPDQRLTRVPFAADSAPLWLPSSAAILVSGHAEGRAGPDGTVDAPVEPLEPGASSLVHRIFRSGTTAAPTALEAGWRVLGVAPDGTIAYVDERGALNTTPRVDSVSSPPIVFDVPVAGVAFGPHGDTMIIAVAGAGTEAAHALERLDLESGRRTPLVPEGDAPRWLP